MERRERRGEEGALLDLAEEKLGRGDAAGALRAADEVCRKVPGDVRGLHLRAAALADLGRTDEARRAYEQALERGRDDPALLADAAAFLVGEGEREPSTEDLERGLSLARRGIRLAGADDALSGELALVEGQALCSLGDPEGALPRLAEAKRALPEEPSAHVEHALALFELCRFEEAGRELDRAVELFPEDAWAHHARGRVAERLGRRPEAKRSFARAHELAPEEFPRSLSLSPAAFDRAVEAAVKELPEPVRRYLSNVAITVEALPSEEELTASDPPLSPSILGIFRGAPLGEKRSPDPWSQFPSSITLYQRNLETFARDEQELKEEIGVTLFHEVGHFLGLDEEQLRQRGLG